MHLSPCNWAGMYARLTRATRNLMTVDTRRCVSGMPYEAAAETRPGGRAGVNRWPMLADDLFVAPI